MRDSLNLAKDFIDLWLKKYPQLESDDLQDVLADLILNENEEHYKFPSTKDLWLKRFIIECTANLSDKASTGIFVNSEFMKDILDPELLSKAPIYDPDDNEELHECPMCANIKQRKKLFNFDKFHKMLLPKLQRAYDIVTITKGKGNTLAEISIVKDKATHGTTLTDTLDSHGLIFNLSITLDQSLVKLQDLMDDLDFIADPILKFMDDK